ncbi:hypothetical protein HOH87_05410 [bacterium]|nr:hypothetical protein [bacterium]
MIDLTPQNKFLKKLIIIIVSLPLAFFVYFLVKECIENSDFFFFYFDYMIQIFIYGFVFAAILLSLVVGGVFLVNKLSKKND